jgi:hypothetical protein
MEDRNCKRNPIRTTGEGFCVLGTLPKTPFSRNPQVLHTSGLSQLWPVTPVDAIDGIRVDTCLRSLDERLRNPTED